MSRKKHPQPSRKRSQAVGLTAIGAVAMLSACDTGPSEEELSRQMFGEPTEVAVYQSVAECQVDRQFSEEECKKAQSTALNQDSKAAPRFESREDCEAQFGASQCHQRSGIFMPLMAGFMIGRMMNGGANGYAGLYRDRRNDTYYSGSGAWVNTGKRTANGNHFVGKKAFDPVVPPKVQTRSDVRSRGGFGARASIGRGGGWGG